MRHWLTCAVLLCLSFICVNDARAQTVEERLAKLEQLLGAVDAKDLKSTVEALTGDLQRVREEFGPRVQRTEQGLVERVPVGTVLPYAGENLQELERKGWMLCDGRDLPSADFPELFAAIGTIYGSPGAGRFFIPDYRGRFLRGTSMDSNEDPDKASRTAPRPEVNTPGEKGNSGNRVGSVQADQFASHAHGVKDAGHRHQLTDSGHSHGVSDPGHSHGISDPGHAHGLAHRIVGDCQGGFGSLARGAGNCSIWDIGIRTTDGSGTNVSVQGNRTGVRVDSAKSGLTVDTTTTNISVENRGGAESRPKNINVNWIIRVK